MTETLLRPPSWQAAKLGIAAALVAFLLTPVPSGSAEPDVLDRPALWSQKAASRVLMAICRAGKRIVAVGERGIIVVSDNDGVSWRQVTVPVSVSLTNVRFLGDLKGWVVGHGGVVLHTEDGGETWVKQLDGRQVAQLLLRAAKAGSPGAGKDAKRALADAELLYGEGPGKPFLDVYFRDENEGFVIGAFGLIFSTRDGGKTWQPILDRIENPRGMHLYSIQADANYYFIVGEQGIIFRSADGGRTFATLNTPYRGTYFGVVIASQRNPIVFGLRGNVYWSSDAGRSWQRSEAQAESTLTAGLRLPDGSVILIDETGHVLLSTDGGHDFEQVPIPHRSSFTGVVQADSGDLILSGNRGITRVTLNRAPKVIER